MRSVKRHAVTQPLDQSYRLIPLTQGRNAVVDAADFDWLMQWNWFARKPSDGLSWYARRAGPDKSVVYMHAAIFGGTCDHRNRNGLDNRRSNLRAATRSQQNANQSFEHTNRSGYKGVCWNVQAQKWKATIEVNAKKIHLGYFGTKELAAAAYDLAAIKHHHDFAVLNAPQIRWNETGIWEVA